MRKKLYLVDVSSMYFRAFYAIRPLHTSKGLPTNALFGFLSMAVKLIKEVKPDYVAFCFDRSEPSFRKEIYQEYKANRSEMPEELVPQVPYVRKITNALGILAIDKPGFEADDVIGTLAVQGVSHNLDVVIVSGDKDFGQLISPNITMYDTLKDVRYDKQGVIEKWGVAPEQFIDYLALTGDSSDNIPGVDGIGPKGAQRLLAEYNSIDEIYKNLDDIKNKNLAKKLGEGKDSAYLSRKLVEIKKDVDLGVKLEDLRLRDVHREELSKLLEELEFQSFLRNLIGNNGKTNNTKIEDSKSDQPPFENSKKTDVKEVLQNLSEDTITPEQVDKHIQSDALVWGIDTMRGLYIAQGAKVFRLEGEAAEFGSELSKKNLRWLGYDVKKFWHEIKIENPTAEADLMLSEYLVKGGKVEGFSQLYNVYVGGKFPELPSGVDYLNAYLVLHTHLSQELEKRKLTAVLTTIDLPLISILYKMERAGILVDKNELIDQSQKLSGELKLLETEIIKEVGVPFNLASPKQLAEVLFVKMKIPPVKKTKTGFSTDSDVLEKLSDQYPICKKIIEHREIAKLKSTYLDALPNLINQQTGRLHTHFNQVGTTTGRLSSHDPNLQNIPIRTDRGARIRRAFVAKKGFELISADYSQIELRLLAHMTSDPGLCEAFQRDQDIHTATASQVFNVKIEDVSADMRRTAKAINFGIAYGQGAFGLAETLGIGRTESAEIIKKYFSRFKNVKEYMTDIVEVAKRQGYVETIFGRRRYLPELKSSNGAIRKFGERAAINAPVQGTAADLVKLAMIKINDEIKAQMILQVHDELLFEVAEGSVKELSEKIKSCMEKVVELKIPLKVNMSHGKNWDQAHS